MHRIKPWIKLIFSFNKVSLLKRWQINTSMPIITLQWLKTAKLHYIAQPMIYLYTSLGLSGQTHVKTLSDKITESVKF